MLSIIFRGHSFAHYSIYLLDIIIETLLGDETAKNQLALFVASIDRAAESYGSNINRIMHLAVMCSEPVDSYANLPLEGASAQHYDFFDYSLNDNIYAAACPDIGLNNEYTGHMRQFQSDIATLVLSGGLDTATTYKNGDIIADPSNGYLTNAQHVIVAGCSHVVGGCDEPCVKSIIEPFIDQPQVPVEASCATSVLPDFVNLDGDL